MPLRCLLDTQVIAWLAEGSTKLSEKSKDVILDPAAELYFSAASVWEMAIKISIGKLKLPISLRSMIERQVEINGLQEIPVTSEHSLAVEHLEILHREPFDRILICQAQIEGMTIITSDQSILSYSVQSLW